MTKINNIDDVDAIQLFKSYCENSEWANYMIAKYKLDANNFKFEVIYRPTPADPRFPNKNDNFKFNVIYNKEDYFKFEVIYKPNKEDPHQRHDFLPAGNPIVRVHVGEITHSVIFNKEAICHDVFCEILMDLDNIKTETSDIRLCHNVDEMIDFFLFKEII